MSETYNNIGDRCPNCGNNTYFRNNTPTALVPLIKGGDGLPIVDHSMLFPVRAYFCKSCSFLHLAYENPVNFE